MTETQRVLFTGDTHGDSAWWRRHIFETARRHRCDLIFQVGDFGLWPGSEGARFLHSVDEGAEETGIPVWWIDGNHEDFDQLEALPVGDGVREITPHITHIPRGHRWEWSGRRFLACGGATSIDVADRLPGRSWWPQEAITATDVATCIAGGLADVMVTHHGPLDVDIQRLGPAPEELPAPIQDAADENRRLLQEIVDVARPRLLIHGHWHHEDDRVVARSVDSGPMRVVSLNADGGAMPQGLGHCGVLDLEEINGDDVARWFTVID